MGTFNNYVKDFVFFHRKYDDPFWESKPRASMQQMQYIKRLSKRLHFDDFPCNEWRTLRKNEAGLIIHNLRKKIGITDKKKKVENVNIFPQLPLIF